MILILLDKINLSSRKTSISIFFDIFFKLKKFNKKNFFLKYLEFLFKSLIDEEDDSIFLLNKIFFSSFDIPKL